MGVQVYGKNEERHGRVGGERVQRGAGGKEPLSQQLQKMAPLL